MRRQLAGALPLTLAALVATLCLLVPSEASANATPAYMSPERGGLMIPTSTSAVRIERERLSIDFTESMRQPKVKASYDLLNVSSQQIGLDLLFVAPGGEMPAVQLDDRPLAVQQPADTLLPVEWTDSSRGMDPLTGEEYQFQTDRAAFRKTNAWSFRLELPAGGKGTLSAEYLASTGYDRSRADHVIHHLAYILGPAKSWAGFGTLELSATVPSHYLLASSPPMSKLEGTGTNQYGATFDGVPADLLTVSAVAAPSSLASWAPTVELAVPFLCAILVGILVGWLFAHLRRQLLATLSAMATAFMGSIILMILVTGEITGRLDPAFDDRSHAGGMGEVILLILAVMLAAMLSLTIAGIWAGVGSRRRAAKR